MAKKKKKAAATPLVQRPADEVEKEARTHDAEGRPGDAARTLTASLVNLTAHAKGPLPCFCKKCLDPDLVKTDASGMKFERDFSIADGRVLFYWLPEELAGKKKSVENSVAAKMKQRLAKKRKR